jgi:molybdopterin-containing oxidoreductase family iron-sulfur binding subunit
MLIDLTRCRDDCTACMDACRTENNVAYHDDRRWDVHWIRRATLHPHNQAAGVEEKDVLLMCNQCDDPPCAMVCPVQATYKRADGIVVVDHHRCIGCRYCMIACPYNARFFNWKHNPEWPNKEYPKRSHGVAESCHFCHHLVDGGELPACVSACGEEGGGALIFGDLNDPDSEISRLIAGGGVKRIREDWGTNPKVYYLGL